MADRYEITEAHLSWTLGDVIADPGGPPGVGRFTVYARNHFLGEASFTLHLRWEPGEEEADVAAKGLGIMSLAFERLSEQLAARRMALRDRGDL